MVSHDEHFTDQVLDVDMAEVSLIPDSEMIEKTVCEIAFRTRSSLNTVDTKHDDETMDGPMVDELLQLDDILLVAGD